MTDNLWQAEARPEEVKQLYQYIVFLLYLPAFQMKLLKEDISDEFAHNY
jgi:hypothetical protein